MKKIFTFLTFSALAVFSLILLFPACEGPQGPAGADGTDGTDGVDANSFCIQCHTKDKKDAVKVQFATASHGGAAQFVDYAGGRNGCAQCHSQQGYKETLLTGRDTTATGFDIPLPLQCDGCHDFHATLNEEEFPDYALRANEPVSLVLGNHTATLDLHGTANVCAYCHQPRDRTEFPLEVNGAATIAVTSKYWGPHHGPQGTVLGGVGGFEVPGSMTYENSSHTLTADCAACHMAEANGIESGGHTFRVTNSDGSLNVNGCNTCHGSIDLSNVEAIQTEIKGLLDDIHQKLMDFKLVDNSNHAIPSAKAEGKGSDWTSNEAGAVFNYLLIEEDRSEGIHNYKYIKTLLTNTLEMVNGW